MIYDIQESALFDHNLGYCGFALLAFLQLFSTDSSEAADSNTADKTEAREHYKLSAREGGCRHRERVISLIEDVGRSSG